MNLVTHLFLKDVRRTRVLLGIWVVLILLQFVLIGMGGSSGDQAMQAVYAIISFTVPFLQTLLLVVIIPHVVHGEPLVGTTAFWLTRPIGIQTLLKAKATYATLLILTPLIVELIVMAVNGVTPRDLLLALPEIFMGKLAWIVAIAILAALTANFGVFAIAAAVTVVGMILISLGINLATLFLNPEAFVRNAQEVTLMSSRTVIGSGLLILGGTAIVGYQYLTRKTRRSIMAAGILLPAFLTVQSFWPWDFLKRPILWETPAVFDTGAVKVEIDGVYVGETTSFRGKEGFPDKTISANLPILGAPLAYVLRIERIDPRLTAANGELVKIQPSQRGWNRSEPKVEAIEAALEGTPIVNQSNGSSFSSQQLFVMSHATFAEYAKKPLTLEAGVDISASKYVAVAVLPLKPGSRYDDGSFHLVVTDVLKQPEGVDILMRERGVRLMFDPTSAESSPIIDESKVVYVLRNLKRKEAILPARNRASGVRFSVSPSGRLVNKPVRVSFGSDDRSDRIFPRLDDEWLADAELVRLELTKVTEFPYQLKSENFRLDAKQSGRSSNSTLKKVPLETLAKIILPPNPTKEQISEYAKRILTVSADQSSRGSNDPQIEMLMKLGSENLDVLMALRSEGDGSSNFYLDQVIPRLVRESDKALIVTGLKSNQELAKIVLKQGWEQDARETLIAGLREGKPNLPTDYVKAVARLQDPTTYDDLQAYFIRTPSNRREVYASLKQIPGLDLDKAVDAAWKKAKFGQKYECCEMLIPAAEHGHLDALEVAADLLANSGENYQKSRAREVLKTFTNASGRDDEMIAWYQANQKSLVFDPEKKRYVIPN